MTPIHYSYSPTPPKATDWWWKEKKQRRDDEKIKKEGRIRA